MPELLERCELHMTQNGNESFQNSVWARVLKSKHHSLRQVCFGVIGAVSESNAGPTVLRALDDVYKHKVGHATDLLRQRKSKRRMSKSISNATGKEKKRRAKRAEGERRAQEEDAAAGPAYRAGSF